jgi:flagellar hook-associated protein 3 FlgL
MRISTQLMYDAGIKAIGKQQGELYRTQQQLSTGKRVMSPSDDPIASSRAVVVAQAQAGHEQYARNLDNAKSSLASYETVLGEIGTILADAKVLAVNAGNAALQDADRRSVAQELRGKFDQLLGLVNSQDGSGKFLFAGYRDETQPFGGSLAAVAYSGDDGIREAQASPSQTLTVGYNGAAIFRDVKNGNGVFAGTASTANLGSGVLQNGRSIDPSLWNGHTHSVQFSVGPGGTTYDVFDATSGITISSGNPYVSGNDIGFSGVRIQIKGEPATGDTFTVAPSQNQSVFETFKNIVAALETPTTGGAGKAQLQNQLNRAFVDFDQAIDQTLAARTRVGISQKQIDDLGAVNDTLKIQRQAELAELQDLDYAKVISDYTRQMTMLEAAQRTQAAIGKLSLFNLI